MATSSKRRSNILPWAGALLAGVSAVYLSYSRLSWDQYLTNASTKIRAELDTTTPRFNSSDQSAACIALAAALPESVYTDQHPEFKLSANSYWSLNACEDVPKCIVQPTTAQEVATAVGILKSEFDATKFSGRPTQFAVRSGGHSPERGFGTLGGGIVIDMHRFKEISLAEDRQSVVVGAGVRWGEVYGKLDKEGLAMVGGRNADVGVSGLSLGGGISFFSPRFGMVCDNILDYEIVLANGTIAHVTSTSHPDLWRALKGGTGNFGIVTRTRAKTFESGNIWSGYVFTLFRHQSTRLLSAFHAFNKPENFDPYAAGPIMSLSYMQSIGLRITATNLAYTKPEAWPKVFDGFRSIWRVWSTNKIHSLPEGTAELERMAPPGHRQFQVTTTVKNDLATLLAWREVFDAQMLRGKAAQGSVWSIVFQPLSAAVTLKGDPNVLGLETRHPNDTLVVVLLCASWEDANDDELVEQVSRDIIALGEEEARKLGTLDEYIYLNYAASGQDVFSGYGMKNKEFLREVARRYDPGGFFQRAKKGGFKVYM